MPGIVHAGALVAFFQWYSLTRAWVAGSPDRALAHARTVLAAEHRFGLLSESRLHTLLLGHPAWCRAANVYYGAVHFIAPVAVLLALYRWRRVRYRAALRAFVIINLAAVLVFWLWPLMPPRLLPSGYGFVDVGARFPGLPLDRALADGPGNGFAAMPSLHLAYAVWCVWAGWAVVPRRLRLLLPLYPVATSAVVVATANHYWLDVVAGAALAAGVIAVTRRPPVAMLGVRLQRRIPGLMTAVPAAVSLVLALTALWWWRIGFRPYVVEDLGWLALVAGSRGRAQPQPIDITDRTRVLTATGRR